MKFLKANYGHTSSSAIVIRKSKMIFKRIKRSSFYIQIYETLSPEDLLYDDSAGLKLKEDKYQQSAKTLLQM